MASALLQCHPVGARATKEETDPERAPADVQLPFDLDDRIDPSRITAHAGVPLVSELFRRVGAAQVINGQVRIKQRQRGLTPAQLVETLIAGGP